MLLFSTFLSGGGFLEFFASIVFLNLLFDPRHDDLENTFVIVQHPRGQSQVTPQREVMFLVAILFLRENNWIAMCILQKPICQSCLAFKTSSILIFLNLVVFTVRIRFSFFLFFFQIRIRRNYRSKLVDNTGLTGFSESLALSKNSLASLFGAFMSLIFVCHIHWVYQT